MAMHLEVAMKALALVVAVAVFEAAFLVSLATPPAPLTSAEVAANRCYPQPQPVAQAKGAPAQRG